MKKVAKSVYLTPELNAYFKDKYGDSFGSDELTQELAFAKTTQDSTLEQCRLMLNSTLDQFAHQFTHYINVWAESEIQRVEAEKRRYAMQVKMEIMRIIRNCKDKTPIDMREYLLDEFSEAQFPEVQEHIQQVIKRTKVYDVSYSTKNQGEKENNEVSHSGN